jgi:uracil permease
VNGFSSAYVGLMLVGIVYVIVATIIRFVGNAWIKKLLPPVVIGPVIIIIGLSLAPIAIQNAGLDGSKGIEVPIVAIITFLTVVIVSLFGRGFVKIVPFIIAILVGYISAVLLGLVDLSVVFSDYHFLQLPNFTFIGTYKLDFDAALMFLPIAFVTIAEHIGDHTVLGEITGEDFITNPGLENTLMGDGIATFVSAAIGGPANTTYGENTGVVAMTKVGSVYVVGLAAMFAVLLGFFGYIQAFITSIPWAVIGGMTIVLYGLIAGNGVKVLVKSKVDLGKMRNLIIVATMLVIGLGGAIIPLNDAINLQGMSLAAVVGIVLNLVLPDEIEALPKEVVDEFPNEL